MLKIHKYEIMTYYDTTCVYLELPKDAQILTIQLQGGRPMLWALVNPDKPISKQKYIIYGTGTPIEIPPQLNERDFKNKYIGTFQIGIYVWHLFIFQ